MRKRKRKRNGEIVVEIIWADERMICGRICGEYVVEYVENDTLQKNDT